VSIALLRRWLGPAAPSPHDTELRRLVRDAVAQWDELMGKAKEMKRAIDKPEVRDFLKGVETEAAHQRVRWAASDGGKTDADWFWLVGYLAGKALAFPEKRLHHTISAAAALFNWHLATLGQTDMRPGIADPESSQEVRAEVERPRPSVTGDGDGTATG